MAQLHDTLMGRKLLEGIIPNIADSLDRIADALEHAAVTNKVDIEICFVKDQNGNVYLDEELMHQFLDEKIQKIKELHS